ncbi:DUF3109 family protein [Rurimicrobium arvi]|uniref:DUF3109 family protein n=1 Tax=Rurimicrobium arvi TaxID=2049916 RepID=A0ABP8MFJ6_9BACT
MIAIDNVLLSDDVISAQFVCDLEKCKGGCCVDGDCGAPITEAEAQKITEIFPVVKKYLPEAYVLEVERQGFYVTDDEHGMVTPTVNGGICVYGFTDELGVVKCGIEQAYRNGEVDFKKPISCHLFPLRIDEAAGYEMVNYEPRKSLCRPACKLGKKLQVPVYQFLKEPIVRKYGPEFYEALDALARHKAEE